MAMRRLVCWRHTPSLRDGIRLLSSSDTHASATASSVSRGVIIDINDHETIRKHVQQGSRVGSSAPAKIPYTVRRKAFESAVGVNANPDYWFRPGFDFVHWQVYTKPLRGTPPTDVIVRYYIQTLSRLFGSEKEAVEKIYSVATRHYYAFGAKFSAELADKLEGLPNVCCVLPDEYVDPQVKRYPWDPIINGVVIPVPYDSKYYPDGEDSSLNDEEFEIAFPRSIPDDRYAEADDGSGVQMTGVPNKDDVPELALVN